MYLPLERPVMVQVVVLAGTGPRSLVPLSSSNPSSLFELSLQLRRMAELLMAVTVRLLGAVGGACGGVEGGACGGVEGGACGGVEGGACGGVEGGACGGVEGGACGGVEGCGTGTTGFGDGATVDVGVGSVW